MRKVTHRETDDDIGEVPGGLPNPDAFADHGQGHRRRRRGRGMPSDAGVHVNINSLLDVLSVILVFLMKSYSASTVQIKPSPALQVPFSHASAAVAESTAITVTLKDVLVDDEPVLSLVDAQVPAAQRSAGGLQIDPLLQRLRQHVEQQQKIAAAKQGPAGAAPFKGIVTVIADRHVPYSLLTQVLYTAGQAAFNEFKFAAIKTER